MDRIIREACDSWNIHNENKADTVTSEWSLIYNAVLCYLRHMHTRYDSDLAMGADRDQLKSDIEAAAKRQYAWLRFSIDPRKTEPVQSVTQSPFRIFDRISSHLSDQVARKDYLTRSLAELKRQRPVNFKERAIEINAEIREIDQSIANGIQYFNSIGKDSELMSIHDVPQYEFGKSVEP